MLVILTHYNITSLNMPIAMRTVGNSWWWAQKMPETCRVLWQNKCWLLMHLVGCFIQSLLRCTVTWT